MKRLFEKVASAIRSQPSGSAVHVVRTSHKVFARIEEPLMAEKRLRKYQRPLHQALMLAGLGHVTGGGSVQGTDGSIQWISLDMELKDLDGALLFACAKLRELGAPARSTVKFKQDGAETSRTIA